MFSQVKFLKEYPGLLISAEIPAIPIDDCPLVLVIQYGSEREVMTSPVRVTADTFPLICEAIHQTYQRCDDDFWIMNALARLSRRIKSDRIQEIR